MFTVSRLAKHSSMPPTMPHMLPTGISETQAEHEEPWGWPSHRCLSSSRHDTAAQSCLLTNCTNKNLLHKHQRRVLPRPTLSQAKQWQGLSDGTPNVHTSGLYADPQEGSPTPHWKFYFSPFCAKEEMYWGLEEKE